MNKYLNMKESSMVHVSQGYFAYWNAGKRNLVVSHNTEYIFLCGHSGDLKRVKGYHYFTNWEAV